MAFLPLLVMDQWVGDGETSLHRVRGKILSLAARWPSLLITLARQPRQHMLASRLPDLPDLHHSYQKFVCTGIPPTCQSARAIASEN